MNRVMAIAANILALFWLLTLLSLVLALVSGSNQEIFLSGTLLWALMLLGAYVLMNLLESELRLQQERGNRPNPPSISALVAWGLSKAINGDAESIRTLLSYHPELTELMEDYLILASRREEICATSKQ